MSTPLQTVYDNFFRHIPNVDFTYLQDEVYGFFQDSLGYVDDTICESLDYTIEENNAVLIVYHVAETNGNITIVVTDSTAHTYTVSVLTTDTKKEIAEKIVTAIGTDFDVTLQACSEYIHPIITLVGTEDMATTFTDTDNTCVQIDVQRTYDGAFTDTLGQDSINLIGMYMYRGYYDQNIATLTTEEEYIGTKNFKTLPNKKDTLSNARAYNETIKQDIKAHEQKFYVYD